MKIFNCIFIIAGLVLSSCKCPDNEMWKGFSADQNEWFSSINDGTSQGSASSSDGESVHLITQKNSRTDRQSEQSSKNCYKTLLFDVKNIAYNLSFHSFYFEVSSLNTPPILGLRFYDRYNTSGCDVDMLVNLDDPKSVSEFYYYPFYASAKTDGFIKVSGDTLIKGKTYSDIYCATFNLPSNSIASNITKIWLSKKQGMVAYQWYSGKIWYLAP